MEYYSAMKKEQNWVIGSEVDAARARHTQCSKSQRDKEIRYINTYIWNLKKKKVEVMLSAGQEQRHRHREWTCGRSRGRRGGHELRQNH